MMRFENGSQKPPQPTLIACRVCDQVFSDNRSLLYHFEIHVEEGVTLSVEHLNKPKFPTLSNYPFSQPVERPHDAGFPSLPKPPTFLSMETRAKEQSLFPTEPPNPLPSFKRIALCDEQSYTPLPISSPKTPCYVYGSQTARPSSYSQLLGRNFAVGGTGTQSVASRPLSGHREKRLSRLSRTKLYIRQLDKPIRELIVIDDSDDDNEWNGVDLSLKL